MSGVTRGSDVVSQQESVGLDVEELDDIIVADNPSTASLRESLGGDDHPVVVFILMRITCNLLSLTANSLVGVITRVALRVRVQ